MRINIPTKVRKLDGEFTGIATAHFQHTGPQGENGDIIMYQRTVPLNHYLCFDETTGQAFMFEESQIEETPKGFR